MNLVHGVLYIELTKYVGFDEKRTPCFFLITSYE